MKFKVFIILLLFGIEFMNAENQTLNGRYTKGLTFYSHLVNKDERTSLHLTPNGNLSLTGGFTIEFDIKLERNFHNYGYIMRVISAKSESLDLISNTGDGWLRLILNSADGNTNLAELRYDRDMVINEWTPLKVEVSEDVSTLFFNGLEVCLKPTFDNFTIEHIYFGVSKHEIYFTTDVPPMSIRNIVIKNKRGKIIRDWDLGRHTQNATYDSVGKHKAAVLNPNWEIDQHSKWKKEMDLTIREQYAQIATDSVRNRIMVATPDSLYILSLNDNSIQRMKPQEGRPYTGASSYLIYDYENDRLISYNNGERQLIFYDFAENKWDNRDFHSSQNQLLIQHHNRFIDREREELVLFGGYGIYKYNANLFKHHLGGDDWQVHDMRDNITPRYLASSTHIGNGQLLVFGGYGSKSGMQEASPLNISDLIKIDSRNNTSRKIGEFKGIEIPQTYSNSMIISPDSTKLYMLAYRNDLYKSSIRLFELNIDNFTHRYMSDSIPYNFQDTESFCDTYLYNSSKLYAVVLQKLNDNFNVAIHSLHFPPLTEDEILQTDGIEKRTNTFIIISILLVTMVITVMYIMGSKKKSKKKPHSIIENQEDKSPSHHHSIPSKKVREKKQTISLLGGFQAFDRYGIDVTGQFTPIIRQMFLYCLLKYTNSGKGVTSENLEEFLWPDLEKAKAINNRNVNIRKLRLLLNEIGDISFHKTNMYWQVNIGNNVYCDYTSILSLLNSANNNKDVQLESIERILDIASTGTLLPNQDGEWIDAYKASYATLLIGTLTEISKQNNVSGDLNLLIRIADVILIHDNIDEDSIKMKCRSLYLLGQKGLSKQFYDKFYEDYKSILNEEPKLDYASIIKEVSSNK